MELLDYCARSEKLGRVTKKMSRSRVLIKARCTGSRFACSRKRLDEPTAIIGLRFDVNFRFDTMSIRHYVEGSETSSVPLIVPRLWVQELLSQRVVPNRITE